jgi:hypothetical protein
MPVKFGHLRYTVDVLQQILRGTQEGRKSRLAFAPAQHVAVMVNYHFEQPGRGPVFRQQAPQNRLEVFADLDGPQFARGVLANLVGVTDPGAVMVKSYSLTKFPGPIASAMFRRCWRTACGSFRSRDCSTMTL